IQAADPATRETLAIQPDHASAGLRSSTSPRANQLGAIVRPDPRVVARSLPGAKEQSFGIWVCAALGENLPGSHQTYLQHLVARFDGNTPRERAKSFLDAYIHALVPPLLRFTCTYGVVLEAHLQNMMVVHAGARILGFVIRDLGGIRLCRPRLQRAGYDIDLAPGSFLISPDHAEFLAKLTHTLLHAHLGSVIAWAQATCDADPNHAWQTVRREITTRLATWARLDPSIREACQRDQATLLAPTHRAKALFAMRLLGRSVDYHYTTVDNPLAHSPPRPSSPESSS
ncbi:MAG: IucA/IucC family C-terminal-domain containing protein, partial [Nannocystaceae bacterium]